MGCNYLVALLCSHLASFVIIHTFFSSFFPFSLLHFACVASLVPSTFIGTSSRSSPCTVYCTSVVAFVVVQNIECPRHVHCDATRRATAIITILFFYLFDFIHFYCQETDFCTRSFLFLFVFHFHKEKFFLLPIMVAERGF